MRLSLQSIGINQKLYSVQEVMQSEDKVLGICIGSESSLAFNHHHHQEVFNLLDSQNSFYVPRSIMTECLIKMLKTP